MTTIDAKPPVLIVDDEPSVCRIAIRVLSRGFTPLAVPSGEAALTLLAGGAFFAALFCDLCLPGMSGRELFARLQSEYPEQASRFVLLSGAVSSLNDDGFLYGLESRLLEKPVLPADLFAMASSVATMRTVA